MKILLYSDISLAQSYRAGNVNAFMSLLEWLCKKHDVTLLYTHHKPASRTLPRNVKVHWRPDFFNLASRKFRTWLGRPKRLLEHKRSWFKRWQFDRLLREESHDAVIISYIDNAFLLDSPLIGPGTRRIVDLHDLMFARAASFREHGIVPTENLVVTRDEEMNAISRCDRAIVLQAPEGRLIDESLGRPVALLTRRTLAIGTAPVTARNEPLTRVRIGFIGTTTEFNVDAARQLLGALHLDTADVEYEIAGSVCSRLDHGKMASNVTLGGVVEDIAAFYDRIDILANPIRFGSGLKTKNVEALVRGVPVITTRVGAEGLEDLVGSAMLVAESQQEFAMAVDSIRAWGHDGLLRLRIAQICRDAFSEDIVFRPLETYLNATSSSMPDPMLRPASHTA
jgi:glycosyltransferase involved in cell wall biosynthesis